MKAVVKPIVRRTISRISAGAVNGPAFLRSVSVFGIASIDDRRCIRTRHGTLTVRTGTPIERWRADTLLSKEPTTIEWLERTIDDSSVFYDVGANIGLYTLFACHLRPGRVRSVCFEPEAQNFARLNQNIRDNSLSQRVLALPVALGREDAIIEFRVSQFIAGAALHGDHLVAPGTEAHRQGAVATSLDALLMRAPHLPRPTHLKIDVDGAELDVLAGATGTLADRGLRHLMVELQDDVATDARAAIERGGWRMAQSVGPAPGICESFFERLG